MNLRLVTAALLVLALGTAVTTILINKQNKFAKYDSSITETGRWIVYSKKGLMQRPGVRAFSVPGGKTLEGLNAAVFDSEPVGIKSDDIVVQKELVHHVFMGQTPLTACYKSLGPLIEVACPGASEPVPTPTPTPTPIPTPAPVPTPPSEVAKSWGITRVHAIEAKAKIDTSKVRVCIVDTGADLKHPNGGKILGSQDYTGKGSAQDGAGHGTHVAGTVSGIAGVGVSRAGLLICKGLDDRGSGSSSALAQCLSWCGAQGAQIVSNSWGSSQSDGLINQAIKGLTDRGIYVFVAAGNDSGPVNWPAKLAGSNPLVYAIAASDMADKLTDFSSRGPEIRFIAPGARINSNWPGGGSNILDGTSMSTPHVAGICAYGVAKNIKPCIKTTGIVGSFPFADALETAK